MSKPRAVFHQEQSTMSKTNNSMSSSPRISVSSPHLTQNEGSNSNFDHGYHNQVPRRVKHIEGHIMAEIFASELTRFQGYRCVCSKPVSEEEETRMFMCCQGSNNTVKNCQFLFDAYVI
jgi:hypothetical protein